MLINCHKIVLQGIVIENFAILIKHFIFFCLPFEWLFMFVVKMKNFIGRQVQFSMDIIHFDVASLFLLVGVEK
jgi:hypothetical protein